MQNLLHVNKVSKAYGQQVILDQASFSVGERKKIAVIGRNGAGKSTLFKIITGQEEADLGEIIVSDHTHIGYLEQEENFQDDDTVLSYLLRESGEESWACATVASKFDLKDEKLESLISSLSGGYQMRVKLSAMLLKKPNIILLDEPTNYLDLSTTLLLEKFLVDYNGAYLIISHDRNFIKNTCNEVLEIERGQAYYFPNTLEHYFSHKSKRLEADFNFNKKQEKKKEHLQSFIDRFGAKASKAAQAKSKAKQIEKLETVDIGKDLADVRIKILNTDQTNGFAWRLTDLAIGYGNKKVANDICLDIEKGVRIAVLGDNGQGKSTFLRTLAEDISPVDGALKKFGNLNVAYYAQHVSAAMSGNKTVEQYLQDSAGYSFVNEEIYKMAGNFLFRGDDLKKPISILSGGEKARLCIAGILLHKNDVLLLDEPTSHLDFETVEVLAQSLAETNVTIIFVSHDRMFINLLSTKILEVKDGTIKQFYGDFADYIEHLESQTVLVDENPKERFKKNGLNEYKALQKEKKMIERQLRRVEKEIKDLIKEKDKIVQKLIDHPKGFDPELNRQIKKLELKIITAEEEWFTISEK